MTPDMIKEDLLEYDKYFFKNWEKDHTAAKNKANIEKA
jgi:hypothetical protein